jgi:methylmalonyl-CoA mutase
LVEYADKLTDLGLKPEHIFQNVSFSVAVGGNYFMEIAKLRALRLLWANILNAYQVAEMPCNIHTRTATWNKSTLDVYNNLLRVTTEAMSAVIGGADSLTVTTYDEVLNNSAEDIMHEQAIFARRIARNLPILLKEEAHLDKVTDASHGAYYIEHLTAQLAQKAWALFQNIEAEGGFISTFEQGLIQAEIEQIATLKRQRFAEKKEILVGVNRYENPKNEVSNAKPTQKITPASTLRLLSLQRLAEEKESGQ